MSVVGIDLGTTNTVVACVRDGRVHVLADEKGNRLLPSVVSFHPNGDVLVGYAAKARRLVDPANTIASIKRLIGRPFDSEEIRLARSRFAFELREGPGQGALVVARGEAYTLPEISAFVLKRVRQIAEAALGEVVDKAVITVPAHFNELQRTSTKVAGRVAGLDVLRILNEPTAAALAYGFGSTQSERVAVFDFGGGTFDCSLLDLTGTLFEVLATAGDTFLGGDDVDTAIAEQMCNAFLAQHRYDPRVDPQAFEKLRAAAENLKKELSTSPQAQVELADVAYGVGGKKLGLTFGMTQADLDVLAAPYIDRTLQVTQDALNIARLAPSSFDQVVLVGGSTRMPIVKRRVEAYFGVPIMDRVNPDEVVAIGAAVQAAALVDAQRQRSIPAAPQPGARPQPLSAAPPPSAKSSTSTLVEDQEEETTALRNPADPRNKKPAVARTTQPSAQAPGRKNTLRPAPPGPPLAPPPPFGAVTAQSPSSTTEADDHDNSFTKMNSISVSLGGDHSFASSNTLPAAGQPAAGQLGGEIGDAPTAPRRAPDPLGRGETPSLTRGPMADPSLTRAPADHSLMTRGQQTLGTMGTVPQRATGQLPVPGPYPATGPAAEPPSITSPPNTQALPTLRGAAQFGNATPPPLPAAAKDPSRVMQAPQIKVSAPTPWPGWNAVGPLPTDDISLIVPDAGNVSISRPSPLGATQPGVPVPTAAPPPAPPHGTLPIGAPAPLPMPGFQRGAVLPTGDSVADVLPVGDPRANPGWAPQTAPVLVDVTPRALVVETVGGFCDTVIPRNAKIPCEHTRVFATGRDLQTVVHVRVAQGEAQKFPENTYLGELELSGLRPAPRGDVTLSVTFELDADGTLKVRAVDTVSGREAHATMKLVAVAQTEEEIEEMIERSRSVSVTGG